MFQVSANAKGVFHARREIQGSPLSVEGRPGQHYEVRAYTPQKLTAIAGVSSIKDRGEYKGLELSCPSESRAVDKAGYARWQVRIRVEPNAKVVH